VLFRQGRPVFIDVGSIDAPHASLPWPALAQFNRFVRYPLHLYGASLPELARARLQDLALGVSADLAMRALPAGYKLRHPLVTAKLAANRAAEQLADRASAGSVPAAPRPVAPETLKAIRKPFFAGLRRELEAIPLTSAGAWVSYYASCPSMAEADAIAKAQAMERVLATLQPATVLDLGANTGQYAKMAAKAGARVIALDQDEASVAALYRESRVERLDILPLVMDLGNPTPANGWCAAQRPDALTRLQSDTAFMLALIHHLVFTGNASLAQVAQLAGRAAKRHVVLEWVAPEDPMARHLRRTATKDFGFYTREAMIAALEAEGFSVEAIAPHSSTRQLLVGTRS
jgi:predicted RNA methylase